VGRLTKSGKQITRVSFFAHSQGVLAQLPPFLAYEVPAVLTHKAAVSRAVMDMLAHSIAHGQTFSGFSGLLSNLHREADLLRHLRWADSRCALAGLAVGGAAGGTIGAAAAGMAPSQRSITAFAAAAGGNGGRLPGVDYRSYEERSKQHGSPMSSGYFAHLFTVSPELQAERQLADEEMRSLPATVLKHDHLFLKGIDGRTVALSIMLNEHQQVVQFLCQDSGSVSAIARPLRQLAQRPGVRNGAQVLRPSMLHRASVRMLLENSSRLELS
jgi:hypothetical protein